MRRCVFKDRIGRQNVHCFFHIWNSDWSMAASTNFIFQKSFENFSHEVIGLVGSNLRVIILRKSIGKGGIDTIRILSQDTIYTCGGI